MTIADFHVPKALRKTLAQVARVTCPPDLDELDLVEHVLDEAELQLRAFPAVFRVAMVAGIATLEVSSIVRYGRPFSRLSRPQAERWFHSFWASPMGPFRQLAKALKALFALGFYQAPAIRSRIEYHPDRWIAEKAKQRLEEFGLDIARHEEELLQPNPLLQIGKKVRHA